MKDNYRLLSVDERLHLFAGNSKAVVFHRFEIITLNGRGYNTWVTIQLTWNR